MFPIKRILESKDRKKLHILKEKLVAQENTQIVLAKETHRNIKTSELGRLVVK